MVMLLWGAVDAETDDDDAEGENELDEDSDDLSIRVLNVTYSPKSLLLIEGNLCYHVISSHWARSPTHQSYKGHVNIFLISFCVTL